ncbi:MAG: hypothetical protein ACAI44_40280 [Candidatus Sericytochromatia bacterium]
MRIVFLGFRLLPGFVKSQLLILAGQIRLLDLICRALSCWLGFFQLRLSLSLCQRLSQSLTQARSQGLSLIFSDFFLLAGRVGYMAARREPLAITWIQFYRPFDFRRLLSAAGNRL